MSISITTLLTAIFVVFKLLGYIDWAWWLVLLPSLLPLIFIGIIIIIVAIIEEL